MNISVETKFPDLNLIKKFYINLYKDEIRRNYFENVNKQKNIGIHRFPAIYGVDLKERNDINKFVSLMTQSKIYLNFRNTNEEINSFGAIGCYLSHYYLWNSFFMNRLDTQYLQLLKTEEKNIINGSIFKPAYQKEDEYLLVFEDDANIDTLDKQKLQNLLSKAVLINNNDWDIFLIYSYKRDSSNIDVVENFRDTVKYQTINNTCNEEFCEIQLFFGTCCYIIKKKAIKKILESGYLFPIECHIDAFLSLLAQKNIIKIISTNESSVEPISSFDSSINHVSPTYYFNFNYYSYYLTIILIIIIIIQTIVVFILLRRR